MEPEKKYFVVEGIQEEYGGAYVYKGYWLCCKNARGVWKERFFEEKKEADNECKRLREVYGQALSVHKEGDRVWFVYKYLINVGVIEDIVINNTTIFYKISDCSEFFKSDRLFKDKQSLIDYLLGNIVEWE